MPETAMQLSINRFIAHIGDNSIRRSCSREISLMLQKLWSMEGQSGRDDIESLILEKLYTLSKGGTLPVSAALLRSAVKNAYSDFRKQMSDDTLFETLLEHLYVDETLICVHRTGGSRQFDWWRKSNWDTPRFEHAGSLFDFGGRLINSDIQPWRDINGISGKLHGERHNSEHSRNYFAHVLDILEKYLQYSKWYPLARQELCYGDRPLSLESPRNTGSSDEKSTTLSQTLTDAAYTASLESAHACIDEAMLNDFSLAMEKPIPFEPLFRFVLMCRMTNTSVSLACISAAMSAAEQLIGRNALGFKPLRHAQIADKCGGKNNAAILSSLLYHMKESELEETILNRDSKVLFVWLETFWQEKGLSPAFFSENCGDSPSAEIKEEES